MVEFIDGVKGQNYFLVIALLVFLFIIIAITIVASIRVDSTKGAVSVMCLCILVIFTFCVTISTLTKDEYNSYPTISLNGEKFKVTHTQYKIYKLRYEDILKKNNGDKEKTYTEFLEEFSKEMK